MDLRLRACCLVLASVACETPRLGLSATCNSDRDCKFGLVCRGAPVGESGERRCVFEQYESCASNADCYPGRICRNQACGVQCLADADCLPLSYIRGIDRPDAAVLSEGDYTCVVGECRVHDDDRSCLADVDCTPGEECIGGSCRMHSTNHCKSDADCARGQRCLKRACQ